MKKILIGILSLLILTTMSAYASDKVKLVAATINPDGSLLAEVLQAYTEEVNNISNGKVAVDFFPGGQLGDASTLYQSVVDGSIDIIYSDPGWFAERHPEFDILEGNYLFKSKEHFLSVVNDEHKLDFFKNKLLKDPGVVVLMVAGGLERDIISTFAINSIDDLKGKNMRSKSTSTNMDWWHSIGANPVPVAFKEIYTAVQTGVVRGSQNSLDAMITMRLAEVNKYIARTQHNISLGFIVMNKAKYDALGGDVQALFTKAAKKIQPMYLEKAFALSDEKIKSLQKDFGIQVTDPDKTPFIKASRTQIDDLAKKFGVTKEINSIFE